MPLGRRLMVLALALAAGCLGERDRSEPANAEALSWKAVAIGSVFETRTVTHLQRPLVRDTVTETRQTLVAKTGTEAAIQLETSLEGAPRSAQKVNVPLQWAVDPPACEAVSTQTSNERCSVPAGTFDCKKTRLQCRDGHASRSSTTWTAAGIPIPVKSVLENENLTSTTELTRSAAPSR